MQNSDAIDSALFDELTDFVEDLPLELNQNCCPECDKPMSINGLDYICLSCGYTCQMEADMEKNHCDTINGPIKIHTGSHSGRWYNLTNDYAKTQHKMIKDKLASLESQYKGNAFPQNVLNETAERYNAIQKLVIDDEIKGEKKFVSRGNIKDEILAAILFFVCIKHGTNRKKDDIAKFMCLANKGFAKGEDKLRDLSAEGKFEIPVNENLLLGFVERYLEALNIENPRYAGFIIDIVQRSEEKKIGMNCQLSSKIVGAIYILIIKCKLDITDAKLESATDNTKKNTFVKLSKIVASNIRLFADIFDKYEIPK